MLDFYLINDNQSKPNNPKNLKYAGGLDCRTFGNLQDKGIIDKRLDYHSDFRWGPEMIEQIIQSIIKNGLEPDKDVKLLLEILEKVKQKRIGLIAYSD